MAENRGLGYGRVTRDGTEEAQRCSDTNFSLLISGIGHIDLPTFS